MVLYVCVVCVFVFVRVMVVWCVLLFVAYCVMLSGVFVSDVLCFVGLVCVLCVRFLCSVLWCVAVCVCCVL